MNKNSKFYRLCFILFGITFLVIISNCESVKAEHLIFKANGEVKGHEPAIQGDEANGCLLEFKSLYFDYRRRNNIGLLEDLGLKNPIVRSIYLEMPLKIRVLFSSNSYKTFDVSREVLECAADNGDQLANYILGVGVMERDLTLNGFLKGLNYLEASSAAKVMKDTVCYDIDSLNSYECAYGLPEAILFKAKLYSDCRMPYFNPSYAEVLFDKASKLGALDVSEYHKLKNLLAYKETCYK